MDNNFFRVSGYWQDDPDDTFENYIIYAYDNEPTPDSGLTDDDIFFYGMGEWDIKEAIELGENTVHDFVITSYDSD